MEGAAGADGAVGKDGAGGGEEGLKGGWESFFWIDVGWWRGRDGGGVVREYGDEVSLRGLSVDCCGNTG